MISSIIQTLFKLIQPKMNDQEKKRQRIYDMLDTETQPKVSLSTVYKAKKIFYRKRAFKKNGKWRIEQKLKEGLLTALTMPIKDTTISIRKHANELKVNKKTVMTAIK